MTPKAFAALAAVTLLSLIFAITSFATQTRLAEVSTSGAPLFPGLPAQAARIAKVELKQGDKTIVLARRDKAWSLADRADYPAKAQPVQALLLKLAQAELVEPKTRNKDRYGLLELDDPAAKDAKSRLVRFTDDKGGVIAEAVVGKKRSDAFGAAKSGTYVRKPADAQTWLANADIDVSMAVRDWTQASLVEVPIPKIAALTVEIPGEEPLKITRDAADASKHVLVGMPEGKKLKEAAGLAAVVRAAGSIELEDVRKAPEGAPAADAGVAKLEADGGLAVTLRFSKAGEDYWLTLEAAGAEGDAKTTADDITARTKGWQYKIPAIKAQSILKRRADLLDAS